MRIVSLLPNCTEIVYALGFGDHVVGRSHECDYPGEVEDLPICTQSKIPPASDSKTLDKNVNNLVKQGLSVYEVLGERLKQLKPDIILTQMQCEVCAASTKDVEHAVDIHLDYQPKVVTLSPNKLEDIFNDIQQIAETLEAPEKGQELINALKARTKKVETKASKLDNAGTIACVEWVNPLMMAGNWIPKLVEMANAKYPFGQEGDHAPMIGFDDLKSYEPDKIVLMPCGYSLDVTKHEFRKTNHEDWQAIKAYQNGEVYVTEANQFFNRSGPRIVDSLEILAEILHPSHFKFGHEGINWIKYPMD